MGELSRHGWLVAVGLAYPVAAFGVLLGWSGPLAFHPLAIPLPAVLLAVTVIGLRSNGVQLRWWAVALFVAWLTAVVFVQWLVIADAAAAV